jgi:hypothetical protein
MAKTKRRISMNPKSQKVNTMNYHRQPARLAVLAVLLLVTVGSLVTFSAAADAKVKPLITLAQLAGPWQVSVVGNTGCGFSSLLFDVTLNASGTGTATLIGHSGCGDSNNSQTFTINSLNSNGSGTAGLTCGAGCGWTFAIQVAPNKQVFNLVDVTDPSQYLAGAAVKQ